MDIEDDNLLMVIEEWADMQSLRAHVCADGFRVILSALDYACDQPEVRFDTVAESRGMGLIVACRNADAGNAGGAGSAGGAGEGWPGDPPADTACEGGAL